MHREERAGREGNGEPRACADEAGQAEPLEIVSRDEPVVVVLAPGLLLLQLLCCVCVFHTRE